MKVFLTFLIICITLLHSCKQENQWNRRITGEWKLITSTDKNGNVTYTSESFNSTFLFIKTSKTSGNYSNETTNSGVISTLSGNYEITTSDNLILNQTLPIIGEENLFINRASRRGKRGMILMKSNGTVLIFEKKKG